MEFVLLFFSFVLLIFSLRSFGKGRPKALILLLLSGFCLRLSLALFDSILNIWDESFHAVVAKNFTKHWLMPTLYDDPLLPLGLSWIECNVWLHKQPLFLWQMAICIKIFGANVLAVRLPSVILSTIQIYFIYAIGKKAVNENTGYYAALIYAFAYYPLALVSGAACNDHNDVAFVFYICASLWAWFNYSEKKKWKWALAIGLFAGMAVMVKWLAGVLVFGGWGLTILWGKESRLILKSYMQIIVSFLLCCAVFLPWQFYIFKMYPAEANYEYGLITKHFTDVIEFHGGPWYFYFQTMKDLYPFLMDFGSVLIFFTMVFLFRDMKNTGFRIFIFSSIVFVYIFFSIAATKMVTFTFIVSPFIYIALGNALNRLQDSFNRFKYQNLKYLLLFIVLASFFNVPLHGKNHFGSYKRAVSEEYKRKLDYLKEKFKGKDIVLFNTGYLDATQIMFFTDWKVYTAIPKQFELETVFALNKTPVIIHSENLPGYILNDERINVLDDFKFPPL